MSEVFGIREAVIERLSAIENPRIEISDKGKIQSVNIEWGDEDRLPVGEISLGFTGGVDENGMSLEGSGVITSFHEVRVPFEGVTSLLSGMSAILTTIANINELASRTSGEKHLVVANRYSMPIFEKLKLAGLYHYSDHRGNIVAEPIDTKYGRLFVADYPVSDLRDRLKKFVLGEVVEKLLQLKD